MSHVVRSATAEDVAAIQAIEVAAGALFAEIGMQTIADDPPPSAAEVMIYVDAGRAWVATGNDDLPLGFALASTVDGDGHLDQVSVHPDHGRRGIGRQLIDQVVRWTRSQGYPALTLTTFVAVAFNGPYYESLGFAVIEPSDLGPGLRAIRSSEIEAGLDVAERAAMIRHL